MNREERKKILLLSDDLRFFSGVGTQSKEIVCGTVHHYNWVQMGGGLKHAEAGKVIDLSVPIAKETGVADAYVKIYPVHNYGNQDVLFSVMEIEKPDAILHFTDPRYWDWLYQIENRIRTKIPITYLNIWDDLPFPMWNRPFYMSCDALFAITKQTYNINKWVIGPEHCRTIDGEYDKDGKIIGAIQ